MIRDIKCEFLPNSNAFEQEFNILKHTYIPGGALIIRDSFLLCDINDIDIVSDTHNLSKSCYNPLQKYHMMTNVDEKTDESNQTYTGIQWQNKYKNTTTIKCKMLILATLFKKNKKNLQV